MNSSEIINNVYKIPSESIQKLTKIIEEKMYAKGHILCKANRIEPYFYFIKQGIVRAYAYSMDDEITFWFGKEGDAVLSMKSYVSNLQGYENIELLEDSIVFAIPTKEIQKLYAEDIHIANWGRRLAEQELIKTEERLLSRQVRTATERYKELLQNYPELVQRVQLGYIASYLGITQVSLSRIRAENK